jgi:hypothetical protein
VRVRVGVSPTGRLDSESIFFTTSLIARSPFIAEPRRYNSLRCFPVRRFSRFSVGMGELIPPLGMVSIWEFAFPKGPRPRLNQSP